MSNLPRNYSVRLGSAWPSGSDPPNERCFTIDDEELGMRYSVYVGGESGKQRITKLAIVPMREGVFLDQKDLDHIPLRRFAKLIAEQFGPPTRTQSALPLTTRSRLRTEKPSHEEVAAFFKAGWGRRELAKQFGISPQTADGWLKGARDRGLIPSATTGRPRKTAKKDTSEE